MQKESQKMNWQQNLQMQNLKSFTIKKYMSEILKDRYPKHENVIERIIHSVVTDKDIQEFGKLIIDIYELGYLKSINDHKESLSKIGLEAKIIAERQN